MNEMTLVEELLLLTLEDSGGQFESVPEVFMNCGLAGAALMDLALRNRIDSDFQSLWVVNPEPTGDKILDYVLEKINYEKRRFDAAYWIKHLSKNADQIREDAIEELCNKGILEKKDYNYLWLLKERRYPVTEKYEKPEAKHRILSLLYSDEIPDAHDIALIALADASLIFERILVPAEIKKIKPRINQIIQLDLIGGAIAKTAYNLNQEIKSGEKRTIIAGLAGNVMEWYEFSVYGFFAAMIGTQFFPSEDPAVSLIASFSVFAVGFLARPLGGLLFGHIGDKHGRKTAVVQSVILMMIPTLLMALLPTYAQIGIAAPILLVILRLVQGLAVGGEYTSSMVLLVEEAGLSRRGLLGSFAPFGAYGGVLLGSLVGAILMTIIPQAEAAAWGWRLAFLFSLFIGFIVLITRRNLPSNENLLELLKAPKSPIIEVFQKEWKTLLKVFGYTIGQAVSFYLCFVYLSTWLNENGHLSPSEALFINSIALGVLMVLTPFAGAFSDRFGRKVPLLIGTLSITFLAWPLLWLMTQSGMLSIMFVQCFFAALVACFGAGPTFMAEAFPKHVRCSGLSISYNAAQSVFGGTVPIIAVLLIKLTGYPLAPSFYLSLAGLVSFLMVLSIMPSTTKNLP